MQKLVRALFIFLFLFPLVATGADLFQEGVHYKRLDSSLNDSEKSNNPVLVETFFWYGCPHCRELEAPLMRWQNKMDSEVTFKHVPAFFGSQWKNHAKLYYTLKALGFENKARADIFQALSERKPLNTPEQMIEYLSVYLKDAKLSESQFLDTYNGFDVLSHLQLAAQKLKAYKLSHVPVVVINEKYLTDVSMAGGQDSLPAVMDYLVQKEQQEQKDSQEQKDLQEQKSSQEQKEPVKH